MSIVLFERKDDELNALASKEGITDVVLKLAGTAKNGQEIFLAK